MWELSPITPSYRELYSEALGESYRQQKQYLSLFHRQVEACGDAVGQIIGEYLTATMVLHIGELKPVFTNDLLPNIDRFFEQTVPKEMLFTPRNLQTVFFNCDENRSVVRVCADDVSVLFDKKGSSSELTVIGSETDHRSGSSFFSAIEGIESSLNFLRLRMDRNTGSLMRASIIFLDPNILPQVSVTYRATMPGEALGQAITHAYKIRKSKK